jgi:hypothetical protein
VVKFKTQFVRPKTFWRTPGLCLVLAAITFAVFGQTLRHEFITFDDSDYVYDNPVVARGLTLEGIVWAFSFHAHNWHPLTWLSHMLDCQLYGLNPGGHHLTNTRRGWQRNGARAVRPLGPSWPPCSRC